MKSKKIGILLMAFGGPDSPEAIKPFLTKLMGGPRLTPVILEKVKARYDLIGGFSPLVKITKEQASQLEKELGAQGQEITCKIGLCYWHPSIKESLKEFADEGFERVVALSISPHYSRASTGAYLEKLKEGENELKAQGSKMEIVTAGSWFDHPLYIEALAEKVIEKLDNVPPEERDDVYIILSAHSLPVAHIEQGDAYVDELKSTVEALIERLKPKHWHLAYQSKSPGQGEWLGPEVEEIMDKVSAEGFQNVLVIPVGFASDHIETLYDIDIVHKKHAGKLGLNFMRTPALNTTPKFIKALADVVKEKLSDG